MSCAKQRTRTGSEPAVAAGRKSSRPLASCSVAQATQGGDLAVRTAGDRARFLLALPVRSLTILPCDEFVDDETLARVVQATQNVRSLVLKTDNRLTLSGWPALEELTMFLSSGVLQPIVAFHKLQRLTLVLEMLFPRDLEHAFPYLVRVVRKTPVAHLRLVLTHLKWSGNKSAQLARMAMEKGVCLEYGSVEPLHEPRMKRCKSAHALR